ncbi:MAG: hypothetical protein KBS35_00240 [Mycoplasma sp.]|nr:hypothetical protein [Candidatus Hennigella equi]
MRKSFILISSILASVVAPTTLLVSCGNHEKDPDEPVGPMPDLPTDWGDGVNLLEEYTPIESAVEGNFSSDEEAITNYVSEEKVAENFIDDYIYFNATLAHEDVKKLMIYVPKEYVSLSKDKIWAILEAKWSLEGCGRLNFAFKVEEEIDDIESYTVECAVVDLPITVCYNQHVGQPSTYDQINPIFNRTYDFDDLDTKWMLSSDDKWALHIKQTITSGGKTNTTEFKFNHLTWFLYSTQDLRRYIRYFDFQSHYFQNKHYIEE